MTRPWGGWLVNWVLQLWKRSTSASWRSREKKVARGRKLRVDTTVVETNIHYPTDSSLLGDGVRVLTRVMKKVGELAGQVGTKLRDRTRSVKLRVLAIARASRNKTEKWQTEAQAGLRRPVAGREPGRRAGQEALSRDCRGR
jgi:hypothetical protein